MLVLPISGCDVFQPFERLCEQRLAASGLPGFRAGSWHGVFAPAGAVRDIALKLNREINHALALPDMKERLADAAVPSNTPEQFAAFLKIESQTYASLIKTAKIKLE